MATNSTEDLKRQTIRSKLSEMNFEQLTKLKERLGLKVYNRILYDSEDNKQSQRSFKRSNKNRPQEISSKVRPSHKAIVKKVTTEVRDPRFDPLCGTFDKKTFKQNFKFLDKLKEQEKEKLKNQLKESEPTQEKKIKFLVQRLDNQMLEEKKNEEKNLIKETELQTIKEKLKRGQKPAFKKKSEKRIENLVKKYEELKQGNKLEKHFKRRQQKLAKKERKVNNFLND